MSIEEDLGETKTIEYLQVSDSKQGGEEEGGYWFEIIELDDKSESQHKLKDESSSTVNENDPTPTPSCVTDPLDRVWTELPWNCITCLQVFNSVIQLIQHHKEVHKINTKDIKWVCPDCQTTTRHYNSLINHVRRLHREKLVLICDICVKKCVTFKELDEHRKEVHNQSYIPVIIHCATCGVGYRNNYHLRRHIASSHEVIDVRFDCAKCTKSYRTKSALVDHQLTHGTPKFTCEQCGKKFARSLNLQQHLTTHITIRLYQCRLCPKSFRTPGELTLHFKIHKNTKKAINCKLFQCELCQRFFRAKQTLRKHRGRCKVTLTEGFAANLQSMDGGDQIKAETEDVKNTEV